MIIKRFGDDFYSQGGALTLPESAVGTYTYETRNQVQEKFHPNSGWTIKGIIHEDYFTWVNAFEASHNRYGKIWGNFEHEVMADSEEGFKHFCKHHEPDAWDYGDI